jgi:alkanesulfonate monooxygenase SsuD/methylene tetrahydromethanopterin reductase-like flavin-dependent oxidoreductase (luciferase family)
MSCFMLGFTGKRFEQQLEFLMRIWSGQPVDNQTGPVGPAPVQPGGPEVLLGGSSSASLKRWGDGFLAGAWDRDQTNQTFRQVENHWKQAGRAGKPRLLGAAYYGLGPGAAEKAQSFLLDYYAFSGTAANLRAHTVLIDGSCHSYTHSGVYRHWNR